MKKLKLLVLMLVLVLPMLATEAAGIKEPNQIWILLAPIIATIITSYGVRLFKWLGIPIEDQLLYPIMVKLIEIIAGVEAAKAGEPGADKKSSVVDLAKAKLKPKEIKLLNRRFGSIDTAVQAAFEMSSTAKKKRSD
jgi:hypothetical protein